MESRLIPNQTKAWAKSLGQKPGPFFWARPSVLHLYPSRLGPGASFADDIFGVQANTLA